MPYGKVMIYFIQYRAVVGNKKYLQHISFGLLSFWDLFPHLYWTKNFFFRVKFDGSLMNLLVVVAEK